MIMRIMIIMTRIMVKAIMIMRRMIVKVKGDPL